MAAGVPEMLSMNAKDVATMNDKERQGQEPFPERHGKHFW